jgi:hypothetical protein
VDDLNFTEEYLQSQCRTELMVPPHDKAQLQERIKTLRLVAGLLGDGLHGRLVLGYAKNLENHQQTFVASVLPALQHANGESGQEGASSA